MWIRCGIDSTHRVTSILYNPDSGKCCHEQKIEWLNTFPSDACTPPPNNILMLWTENKNLKVNGTNYFFFKNVNFGNPFLENVNFGFFPQLKNDEGPWKFQWRIYGIDAALRELLENTLTYPIRGGRRWGRVHVFLNPEPYAPQILQNLEFYKINVMLILTFVLQNTKWAAALLNCFYKTLQNTKYPPNLHIFSLFYHIFSAEKTKTFVFVTILPHRSRFQKFKVECRTLTQFRHLPHLIATDFDEI